MKKGKFIIISGPSGVGKGTICEVLLKELNAWYSVSMTTRGIRDGEVDGVNYYFISKDEFKERIEEGKLLEYNIYNDNYYGTPKDKVLEKLEEGAPEEEIRTLFTEKYYCSKEKQDLSIHRFGHRYRTPPPHTF